MIILNYHELRKQEGGDDWTLTEARFQSDLALFKDKLITPDQFLTRCKEPSYNIDNSVLLTFDDASLSDYTQIYNRHMMNEEIPGFISFIPVDYVGSPNRMSWEMIAELAQNGVTIGSHGMAHVDLTTISDEELDHELSNSRIELEDRLGLPVTLFAFPFGRFSSRVWKAALAAGYTHLFSIQLGYHQGFESFLYSRLCVSKYMDEHYIRHYLDDPNSARGLAWKVSSQLRLYRTLMRWRFR